MTGINKTFGTVVLPICVLFGAIGCTQEPTVSFARDVNPILQKYCIECHLPGGAGTEASGFSVETYEDVMTGTRNGPMVIAGDPLGSNLLVLMEGRADPSIRMPHGKDFKATAGELETIRCWIEQGARHN